MNDNWMVICSKPQQESRAETNLRRQFMEVYCPRVRARACIKPLFPGYLFARVFNDDQFRVIGNTYGVRQLLRVGDEIATISNHEIVQIRDREDRDGIIRLFKRGDAVHWGDIPAIFEEMIDDERCSILFSMLGRANHKVLRVADLAPAC